MNTKKIIRISLVIFSWLLVVGYMVVSLAFVNIKESLTLCSKVDISILDSTKNLFVEEEDLLAIFNDKKIQLIGKPIDKINIAHLEDILNQHPAIKKAEVYKLEVRKGSDGKVTEGILKIDIFQRRPIMRIINKTKESYYIDDSGRLMKTSDKYTAHVLVVNGNINKTFSENAGIDFSIRPDSSLDSLPDMQLYDLYQLGRFIWDHPLWKSQIEQVYINGEGEMEMVPRVGSQTILFGTAADMEEKFMKLEAIYSQGFNTVGWNKYREINLKYKNQVICIKM
jgi:cell division protein FtsQ